MCMYAGSVYVCVCSYRHAHTYFQFQPSLKAPTVATVYYTETGDRFVALSKFRRSSEIALKGKKYSHFALVPLEQWLS